MHVSVCVRWLWKIWCLILWQPVTIWCSMFHIMASCYCFVRLPLWPDQSVYVAWCRPPTWAFENANDSVKRQIALASSGWVEFGCHLTEIACDMLLFPCWNVSVFYLFFKVKIKNRPRLRPVSWLAERRSYTSCREEGGGDARRGDTELIAIRHHLQWKDTVLLCPLYS